MPRGQSRRTEPARRGVKDACTPSAPFEALTRRVPRARCVRRAAEPAASGRETRSVMGWNFPDNSRPTGTIFSYGVRDMTDERQESTAEGIAPPPESDI